MSKLGIEGVFMTNIALTSNVEPKNNYFQVWDDVFTYADNLKCNWLVSKEIFNSRILPKAIENPEQYADLINEMVIASGKKLKRPGTLKKALRILKKLKIAKKRGEKILRSALVELFNSGIEEPDFAKRALTNAGFTN